MPSTQLLKQIIHIYIVHIRGIFSNADNTHYLVYIRGTFSNTDYRHHNYVPIGLS